MPSLLPIVLAADNFPPYSGNTPTHSNGERIVPLHLSAEDYRREIKPIGLLRPCIVSALDLGQWEVIRDGEGIEAVVFKARDVADRSALLAGIAARWKADGMFADALDGECPLAALTDARLEE